MQDEYATAVANALLQVETDTDHQYPTAPDGMPLPSSYEAHYGHALWQWIVQQQNAGFGDIFQVHDSENSKLVIDSGFPGGSCFGPETIVETVAGGRPISTLGAGDRVLTAAPAKFGVLSHEVVAHDVSPVIFGNKKITMALYGFDDEQAFVSPGHVFFTLLGRKAFRPDMAREENPDIHVTQLQVGDILMKLKHDKSGYDRVKIERIHCAPARCGTVHGLHFPRGGGGGSYHANGYLVAENYPDITIHSLRSRFNRLHPRE
ncbi:hypothetical protein KCU99_g6468, partial [Aureobasidium melanogenum]